MVASAKDTLAKDRAWSAEARQRLLTAEAALNAGQSGRYTVWIEGLRSAEDYARTLAYLQRLSVVRSVSPLQVEADRLQVELDMSTGLEGLSRLVETGPTLRLVDGAQPADSRTFRLEP